jgi:DNA-binding IclR family transcriptional regulator
MRKKTHTRTTHRAWFSRLSKAVRLMSDRGVGVVELSRGLGVTPRHAYTYLEDLEALGCAVEATKLGRFVVYSIPPGAWTDFASRVGEEVD